MTRVSAAEIAGLAGFRARLAANGRRGVLAHLVSVEGSHYRRPGARMILAEDGSAAGSISGGCLEADLARQCGSVLAEGRPRIVTYDLRGSADLVWGTGLGCAGRVEILLSPLDSAGRMLDAVRAAGGTATLATALEEGTFALGEQALIAAGATTGSSRLAAELGRGGDAAAPPRVLVETIDPPIRLLVGGAGEDVVPLAAAGRALGWEVRIFAARPAERAKRRFPGFSFLPASEIAAHSDERAAAIVATHNYFDDLEILRALAATRIPYIGLLGARARVERLKEDCADVPGDREARRIFGPAGLDLGAESPEEIALSIAAEIHAVMRGGSGRPLRDRPGSIHGRTAPLFPVVGGRVAATLAIEAARTPS